MRKHTRKICLAALLACAPAFVWGGVITATAENAVLYGEGEGAFYADMQVEMTEDTYLSTSFTVKYAPNLGEGYLGFTLLDEDSGETTHAVLFDEGVTAEGFSSETVSYDFGKNELFKEGVEIRATFDNYENTFTLERRFADSAAFEKTVVVGGFACEVGTTVSMGFAYGDGVELVLDGWSFTSGVSDGAYEETALTTGNNITVTNGQAYRSIVWGGDAFYASAASLGAEGDVVLSLAVSEANFAENVEIGFAFGSERTAQGLAGGADSAAFTLSKEMGVGVYTGGDYTDPVMQDCYADLSSVFASGRSIQAVFNPNEKTFRLLVRLFEGGAYSELYRAENVSYPDKAYYGMLLRGAGTLKVSSVSLYAPQLPSAYALESGSLQAAGAVSATETGTGTTLTLNQEDKQNNGIGHYYSPDVLSVQADESVAFYIQNITEFTSTSPNNYMRLSFLFTNGTAGAGNYPYISNKGLTMFYESGRECYGETETPPTMKYDSLGERGQILNVFQKGRSILATFSPSESAYRLYIKSASDPDFSLYSSYKTSLALDGSAMNVFFQLEGGMKFSAEKMAVYKIKTSAVLGGDGSQLVESANVAVNGGGSTYEATQSEFIVSDGVSIGENEGVAVEYGMEKLEYAGGKYQIGFLLYSGELPTELPDGDASCVYEGDNYVFLAFKESDGLTAEEPDRIRSFLFASGKTARVVFTKDKAILQYKAANSKSWSFVQEYAYAFTGAEACKVALYMQESAKLSVSALKTYKLALERTYGDVYTDDGDLEITDEDVTYCDVSLRVENLTGGRAYIEEDEENKTETSLRVGEEITLVAEPQIGFVFEGWFKDGALVSKDAEYTFDADGYAVFEPKFAKASVVTILNGEKEVEVSEYYKDGSRLGIVPMKSTGYAFVGWEISLVTERADGAETLALYRLYKAAKADVENILPEREKAYVWGTLENAMTSDSICTATDNGHYNALSFGLFEVIEREEYADGTLVFAVPTLACEVDGEGEYTVKRYVKVRAMYEAQKAGEGLTSETPYGDEYEKDLQTVTVWGVVIASLCVAATVGMVIVKKTVLKRREER